MSDEELRELAGNRGCRLVKSRVRTPGRKDHGKFALADAKTGREVFGFGKRGLTATAEEIAQFLRGNAAATWKSSVGSAKQVKAPVAREKKAPKPKPEPKLKIRPAQAKDAGAIAALISGLGYEADAAAVRRRLTALRKAGGDALVADKGGVLGVLTTSITAVLHRPRPVGRLSMLVVEEQARGMGLGTALVAEAEARLKSAGCGLVEVTSNRTRMRAHAFYEKLGYERTSYRFGKQVQT